VTAFGVLPTLECPTTPSSERPFMAGQRPIAVWVKDHSDSGLLDHLERVVNLDAEIPDRTFEFCMTKQ
jgi:hypothetical protein